MLQNLSHKVMMFHPAMSHLSGGACAKFNQSTTAGQVTESENLPPGKTTPYPHIYSSSADFECFQERLGVSIIREENE